MYVHRVLIITNGNSVRGGYIPFHLGIDCGEPETPEYGQANSTVPANGINLGSIVTYSCFTGYTLKGDSHRVCMANSMWSGALPTCEGKKECVLYTLSYSSGLAPLKMYGELQCDMGHVALFVLHCTSLCMRKHVFLACSDETHTNFTLLYLSGLSVG